MLKKLNRNTRRAYLAGFLILLIIELLIERYAHDDFVRPYLGDFLVVILIYCFVMSLSQISVLNGLLGVLIFSFAVEFFQLINIAKVLQYQPPRIIMIMLGSSFSVADLFAYTLGIAFTASLEYFVNFSRYRAGLK